MKSKEKQESPFKEAPKRSPYKRLPHGIKDPKGIPPVESSFFNQLDVRNTARRFERMLFFGEVKSRIPARRKKSVPTLAEERLYQVVCVWKAEYEARFGLVKGGIWGTIQRNIRTWLTMGLLTILFNILVLLIKAAYGIP